MIIRIMDCSAIPGGGRGILLCDDDGNMLPEQTEVKLINGCGDVPLITVTFLVDGENVRFE